MAKSLREQVAELPETTTKCAFCSQPITMAQFQAEGQEVQRTTKGRVHSDCFFKKIGKVFDRQIAIHHKEISP